MNYNFSSETSIPDIGSVRKVNFKETANNYVNIKENRVSTVEFIELKSGSRSDRLQ